MPRESPSKIEDRIQALNDRMAKEKDPELIRAYAKDMILLEGQLQKQNRKSKTP